MKRWIIIGLLFATPAAHAINKCVDSNGRVMYSDTPCPEAMKEADAKITKQSPATGPNVTTEEYLEAARIYGGINKDRQEANESAQRFNRQTLEELRKEQQDHDRKNEISRKNTRF